jgi:hypothetical protein
MRIDARGLEVSAASPEAVEAVNDFTARLVRIDRGVEAILGDKRHTPLDDALARA